MSLPPDKKAAPKARPWTLKGIPDEDRAEARALAYERQKKVGELMLNLIREERARCSAKSPCHTNIHGGREFEKTVVVVNLNDFCLQIVTMVARSLKDNPVASLELCCVIQKFRDRVQAL